MHAQLPEIPSTTTPLPPIPINLRSSSAVSANSANSVSSNSSGLSSIIRRSTSSLARRPENCKPNKPPPSSYPYQMDGDRRSSTSLHRSVSRGFHLPSPSPKSPYHGGLVPGERGTPPLPHSTSFTAPDLPDSYSFPAPRLNRKNGSDTETEADKDEATPRRRRKVRPVSALPPPRTNWDAEESNGFNKDSDPPTSPRAVSLASNHSASGFAVSTGSALKKLGSLSRKHGRRLSGGFMFGTKSSSSSNESRSAAMLETVMGSPSKTQADRAGSLSAPSSVIKSESQIKEGKQRRRQSWNDFVIPKEVLDKQRVVREGIGAVKMFAAGIESE